MRSSLTLAEDGPEFLEWRIGGLYHGAVEGHLPIPGFLLFRGSTFSRMDMIPVGPDLEAENPAGNDLRQRIQRFLAAQGEERVVSAYLFGSVADGSSHRESDVDVAVVLQRRPFRDRLARSQERIRLLSGLIQATGRNEIDLVVLNDAPPRFRRAVVLNGERLLCLDAEGDLAFRRDAQLLAADLDVFMRKMEPLKLEALRK